MRKRLKYNKRFITAIIVLLVVDIAVFIILGYVLKWKWTGFNQQTIGPSTSQYQPGKTLWDWLQLLFIPIALAIGGFWLNQIQGERDTKARKEQEAREYQAAEQRAQIADNNQYHATFQAYIDKLSQLIIEKNLLDSGRKVNSPERGGDELEKRKYELRQVASVQTLTVLSNLDKKRKISVINFIYNLKLIDRYNCVIELSGADLKQVNLSRAILNDADLSGANLVEANLTAAALNRTDLSGAKLSKANLLRAELRGASLSGADLTGTELIGADLRDGDLHSTYLSDAYLNGADLRDSNLSGADLQDANLSSADLSGANLSDVDLSKAESEINLPRSKKQTNLSGIILSNAKLNRANLRGANLHGADLSGADLSDADLTDASVDIKRLKKEAKSLQNTIMPDGKTHP